MEHGPSPGRVLVLLKGVCSIVVLVSAGRLGAAEQERK